VEAGGESTMSLANCKTLYLSYVFFTMLFILLSILIAIVFRHILIRRRYRQMVEEATRNGTWIRVDLIEKPKL